MILKEMKQDAIQLERDIAEWSESNLQGQLDDWIANDVDIIVSSIGEPSSFKEEDRAHAEKFGHSTAMDAARTAMNAEVKHLIIGHISERYGDRYEVLEEARSVFAHTLLAQDLNIINIY